MLNSAISAKRICLRRELRLSRQSLSPLEQKKAAQGLSKQLVSQVFFTRCNKIALYLPQDGEIDPINLVNWCQKHNKKLYLPVIHPIYPNRLLFLPWSSKISMKVNRFGILQPDLRVLVYGEKNVRLYVPQSLDLILLPLVGFDSQGNRMGMGGGFYDRTLAQIKFKGPKLIGLAHECQRLDSLPVASWDIPLDGICTDKTLYLYQ